MTDGTDPTPQGDTTETTCTAVTDNGNGIVFHCVLPPHPGNPNSHFMRASDG